MRRFHFSFSYLRSRRVAVLSAVIAVCWVASVIPTLSLSFLPPSLKSVFWPRELVNVCDTAYTRIYRGDLSCANFLEKC
jgi:hypothetical protein